VLIKYLKNKHLSGAAIDVYPREPPTNGEMFNSALADWTKELLECPNIILTPHIGNVV
jgi:D-3-phosphoglycerate dehydrogenase